MAFVTLDKEKLTANYRYLDTLFRQEQIQWSVVSKMLCGNRDYLEVLLGLGVRQVCDSRVSNLRMIKSIAPEVETVYIKPPPKRSIKKIVEYADYSFNTEYETIKRLSQAATALGKVHKIMIMIELGELREGVLREDLIEFYGKVFELPGIEVAGIGANLTCMYGVLPNHDKLIQLCLYKQLIEAKFNKVIPYVSGGASVTIPLIHKHMLPHGINHFRIGETLFLGTDVYHNTVFEGMHQDVFKFYAEIIELTEKPAVPVGELGHNLTGETPEFSSENTSECSYRAIIDAGLLDVEPGHLMPVDERLRIVGASSDMIVVDLGENPDHYTVGDLLEFRMDYMGVLRIMNSDYIDKRIAGQISAAASAKKIRNRAVPEPT